MALTLLRLTWPLACLLSLGLLCASAVEEDLENDAAADEEIEQPLTKEQLHDLHTKIDSDSDGKISLHEAMEYAAKMSKVIAGKDVAVIMEEMDTDNDGKLSLQEHLNEISSMSEDADSEEIKEVEQRKILQTAKFEAADSNSDGFLESKELPGLFFPETHPGVLEVQTRDTMRLKDSNADGKLSTKEFWELGEDNGDVELSEEELKEFEKLDKDKSGSLDLNELKVYESGVLQTESSLMKLLEVCDKDGDKQCTLQELESSREALVATDAHYQLLEWSQGHEL